MSIVIHDGKTLYTDSGITMFGLYYPPQEKYEVLNDGTIFTWCSSVEDVGLVVSYLNGEIDKPEIKNDMQGLLIYKDGSHKAIGANLVTFKVNLLVYMGSGTEIAMGAYYASNDFRKAIEAACTITNSCALPVVEVRIKE